MRKRLVKVRLISDTGPVLTLGISSWLEALNLALKHKWRPMGSEQPPGWEQTTVWEWQWQAQYAPNDGQGVESEDAQNLGDALVRGLAGLSEVRLQVTMRQVISICRAGGFRIC